MYLVEYNVFKIKEKKSFMVLYIIICLISNENKLLVFKIMYRFF